MRCFVVNSAHHDFSILKSENPEEVINITEGKVNIFHTDRLRNEMKFVMESNGIKDDDFLVISGAGILNVMAASIMKELTGRINAMVFNFTDKKYHKRYNL